MRTTVDHLPDGKRRELAFVVDIIREGFAFAVARRTMPRLRDARLLKIILFGSYARGDWVEDPVGRYFSDFDLLAVVVSYHLASKLYSRYISAYLQVTFRDLFSLGYVKQKSQVWVLETQIDFSRVFR